MIPMFISGRVAITVNGIIDEKDLTPEMDVIFIRPTMDFGTRNKVVGEAAVLLQAGKRVPKPPKPQKGKKGKAEPSENMKFDVGAYQTALLIHNILEWHGPSFRNMACIRENIIAMNPKHPLLVRVLQEISDRNAEDEPEAAGELDDPNVIEVVAS